MAGLCGTDDRLRRQASERWGRSAEWLAAATLVLRGYRILARRYRCRSGEVDIIAVRGSRLAFVEVKARATVEDAEIALASVQCERLANAAEHWLRRRPAFSDHHLGMDAILVCGGWWPIYMQDALHDG
jgi:putative endonuclease